MIGTLWSACYGCVLKNVDIGLVAFVTPLPVRSTVPTNLVGLIAFVPSFI